MGIAIQNWGGGAGRRMSGDAVAAPSSILKVGKFSGYFFIIKRSPCKNFGMLLRRLDLYFGMETVQPALGYGGNLKNALARC